MKLKDILKEIIKETIEDDNMLDKDDDDLDFTTKKSGFDPETQKHTWDVLPQPQLLSYAKEIRKMKRDMKYFNMLPDDDDYAYIKSEAASIITSLNNAEGKIRDLYEKVQWVNRIRKK